MQYLNLERLAAVKAEPFINPQGLLTDAGYARLVEDKPAVSDLVPSFGYNRGKQAPHDRYQLEYKSGFGAWGEFVNELHGAAYSKFIRRMFDCQVFYLNMHWHYTPTGCSVSPHRDALHKLGSHVFYLNEDWQPEWGGQTLILEGDFDRDSAPGFDEFEDEFTAECMGNVSLLFGQVWHGVRELTCPEDKLRQVFIVVINRLH